MADAPSLLSTLADFARWSAAVLDAALGADRPPRRALAATAEGGALLAWRDGGYAPLRPARRGDRAPMLVAPEDAVLATASAPAAAALMGGDARRFAAEAACPFAPGDAAMGLARAPLPWRDGQAAWRVAAAPRRRIAAQAERLRALGARPGRPFALDGARAVSLGPAPRPVGAWATLALAAGLLASAWGAVEHRAASAAQALEDRRIAARATLAAQEAAATGGDPLWAMAQAAREAMTAAPDAGATLAGFAAALPDEAHALRIAASPEGLRAEIAAPDAAGAVAAMRAAAGFATLSLDGPAQIDAATGLQRAAVATAAP